MPNGALRRAMTAHLGPAAGGEVLLQMYRSAGVSAHRIHTPTWSWSAREAGPAVTAMLFAAEGEVALADAPSAGSAGILLHSTHDAIVRWSPDARATVVWLDTDSVVDSGLPPAPRPVAMSSTPLAIGLRAFAGSLTHTPGSRTRISEHVVERLLVEMAHGVLLEHREADAAPYQAVRPMHRARMLMLLNRSEPSYGAQELAKDLGVSPRQLQRLFAKEKSSPAAELRNLRAELALSLLRDPQYDGLTAAQIAAHAGFTNAAAMRRALQAAGAPTPQAARAR